MQGRTAGTISPPAAVEVVGEAAQLEAAVAAMTTSRAIALDTESNSLHRYPEQLCLIQVATLSRTFVIDAISLDELAPLGEVLADDSIVKIGHGVDNEIRAIDRHSGFRIRNSYDTQIAARFAGFAEIGLAALVADLLGASMHKSRRLQRADWGRRPLSAEALEYAAGDVHYLVALRAALEGRLHALGRKAWVAEECARLENLRYAAPDRENAFLSIKGAGGLDERGLTVLRSLYSFREREALHWRRPPFFLMPDAALMFLAASPRAALSDAPGLGPVGLKRFGSGIRQALAEGLAAPPVHLPPRPLKRIPGPKEIHRLARLKAWRVGQGEMLSLDPPLLWPTASLERLAKVPDSLDRELDSAEVRRWQRERLADSLRACLKSGG